MSLSGKTVLITGAALRVGRSLALAIARAGGDVVVHFGKSRKAAEALQAEIQALGRKAFLLQAELSEAAQAADLVARARGFAPLFALVNNASIFDQLSWEETSLEQWNRTMMVNLTAPFLLSQAFARSLEPGGYGRIVNMLD